MSAGWRSVPPRETALVGACHGLQFLTTCLTSFGRPQRVASTNPIAVRPVIRIRRHANDRKVIRGRLTNAGTRMAAQADNLPTVEL
ncbi:hypothetical protein SAMN05444172_4689 [Burkholderia sp. GAS332]|nr:hypothetical protein SAMN05444172_4689 [Burkholderia sp. GAS332]